MTDQKTETEDLVLVDFDTVVGSPDDDKVIASDPNKSSESQEPGQSGADKTASDDQSAEQSSEQKPEADGEAPKVIAKEDEKPAEDPDLERIKSAIIGKSRENRELRKDIAELKGMMTTRDTEKASEDSPVDRWLAEHGDENSTMADVPLTVQRAEAKHEESQRQASQDTRDQKRATDDASSQVNSKVSAVMADPEAKLLLDMANPLMDDGQARIVTEAILTAGDVAQATAKAKTIARIVIEELGTEQHKVMLKALVTTTKQDPKPKSGQSEEQLNNEPAETDTAMEFSAFEGLIP